MLVLIVSGGLFAFLTGSISENQLRKSLLFKLLVFLITQIPKVIESSFLSIALVNLIYFSEPVLGKKWDILNLLVIILVDLLIITQASIQYSLINRRFHSFRYLNYVLDFMDPSIYDIKFRSII